MIKKSAIVLTHGMLDSSNAKTCHGLIRGTERFDILAVIDYKQAGLDAGEVLDGQKRDIPIFASVKDYIAANAATKPAYCIVGVALHGGILPEEFKSELFDAIKAGMGIVCGLHTFLSEDPAFSALAAQYGVELIDVRKPKPRSELHFWTGKIYEVRAPRIAVLGTDCALGKRTTCRMLMETCRQHQIKAEMIYTGQTGWMQGYPHGLIFDSTVNDFISGEIERVIVACDQSQQPDVIFIEGQSALRNPNGPCGSEFLLSGDARAVVLQHAPGRMYYDSTETPIPPIETEVALIAAYGSKVLAITLNEEDISEEDISAYQRATETALGIPVVRPLKEGVSRLIPVIEAYLAER